MPFTKNLCRSQNKFADIRNKITGASCSKLSRYCAVIIAEENGIAYICRTTSGGTGKPIAETHGLAIMRNIVSMLGGTIRLDSKKGKGS